MTNEEKQKNEQENEKMESKLKSSQLALNLHLQSTHPLYSDARRRLDKARTDQMVKAAEKYPEPLNPDSWTARGLADHAAQEMVDLSHYIEALRVKAETAADKPNDLLEWIYEKLSNFPGYLSYSEIPEICKAIEAHFEKGGE